MTVDTTFCSLRDQRDPERHISAVLPWVYEATWPKLDSLIGGPEAARSVLSRWMARESSEASIRRVTVMLEDGEPCGGFIALPGSEVGTCRKADTLAAIGAVGSDRRGELTKHMRTMAKLHVPVADDEYYLSRLGVDADRRNAGRGRTLVHEYLEAGHRAGFRRFRLDVPSDNVTALALYGSVGFSVAAVRQEGSSALIAMAWETTGS